MEKFRVNAKNNKKKSYALFLRIDYDVYEKIMGIVKHHNIKPAALYRQMLNYALANYDSKPADVP